MFCTGSSHGIVFKGTIKLNKTPSEANGLKKLILEINGYNQRKPYHRVMRICDSFGSL